MKIGRISFGLVALSLMFSFQNCSQTRFQSQVAVEDLSSEAQEEAEELSVVQQPPAMQPSPLPAPQNPPVVEQPTPPPKPVTYSTCATETVVQACPSQTPNCTCTDTLRGGTYDVTSLIRGKHTEDVPAGDGSYDKGPNCRAGGTAVHSGTVVNLNYGTCHHFCTVHAKCVNGQWTDFHVTW